MASIFLSHTAKDKKFVRDLASRLKQYNIKVWVDEAEIKLGDSLIKKIEKGINEMEFLGVVLSPNSINSEWVNKEVEIAMTKEIKGKTVKVLPLLLKHCEIPSFLEGKLFADFTSKKNFNSSFDKILEVLRVDKNENTKWDGKYCIRLKDLLNKIKVHFTPYKTEIEVFEDVSGIGFIKVHYDDTIFAYYGYETRPSINDVLTEVFKKKILDLNIQEYGDISNVERDIKFQEIITKYNLSPDSYPGQWTEGNDENGKLAYNEWDNWYEENRLVSFTIEE